MDDRKRVGRTESESVFLLLGKMSLLEEEATFPSSAWSSGWLLRTQKGTAGTEAAGAAGSETAGPRIQSGAADSARWSGIVGLDLENKTHMIRHFSLIRQVLQLALADPERETRDSSSRRSRQ